MPIPASSVPELTNSKSPVHRLAVAAEFQQRHIAPRAHFCMPAVSQCHHMVVWKCLCVPAWTQRLAARTFGFVRISCLRADVWLQRHTCSHFCCGPAQPPDTCSPLSHAFLHTCHTPVMPCGTVSEPLTSAVSWHGHMVMFACTPAKSPCGGGADVKIWFPNWVLIWSIKKARANCLGEGKMVGFLGPGRKRKDAGKERAFQQVLELEAHYNHVRSWVAGNGGLCQ